MKENREAKKVSWYFTPENGNKIF